MGSRQGDVAEAFGSSLAAPAATSSLAMPGSDPCRSPLAQSPTPIDDDSDDSPAPTVIADTDIGHLASELAIGLGTVGSKQGDVAEAYGSFLAAPAATSSSAMPAATNVAAAASSSCSTLLAASASLAMPTAASVASATDAHDSSIKELPMRQRTELSEALSVASATDAHGSSIKEPQVSSIAIMVGCFAAFTTTS